MEVQTRKVGVLKAHPDQASVYGDEPDAAFVEDISDKGVLEALLITRDNTIVSGHRRWKAAGVAGLDEVPVKVFDSEDDLAIRERFISCNMQRVKTRYQKACEAKLLMEVEVEKARRRMAEGGSRGGKGKALETVPGASDGGNARDKVGEALGVSGRTVADMLKVKGAVDAAEKAGHRKKADRLKDIFNTKGVKPAVSSLTGKAKANKKSVPEAKAVEATAPPDEREQRIDRILAAARSYLVGVPTMTFGRLVVRAVYAETHGPIKSNKTLEAMDDEAFLKALAFLEEGLANPGELTE